MLVYPNCGWVEVICGPMYCGKTEELRRRLGRAMFAHKRIALFTSVRDERHDGPLTVTSRDSAPLVATPIAEAAEMLPLLPSDVEIVAIDEAQFFGADLVGVVAMLAERDIRVIVSALDTDYRGHTFGPIGDLLAQAEVVLKLDAICSCCGNTATRSQRLVGGRPADASTPVLEPTGRVTYEARCRRCHMVPERE